MQGVKLTSIMPGKLSRETQYKESHWIYDCSTVFYGLNQCFSNCVLWNCRSRNKVTRVLQEEISNSRKTDLFSTPAFIQIWSILYYALLFSKVILYLQLEIKL